MQQWWDFKCENMDTVLFFKVGKFYEMFHMDSDIGMQELDLIYMKGIKAHSGFPEVAYGKQAAALVAKGYRVARVEQTETPEMLKERNDRKGGKKEKVVAREVCSVMSKGTRTYCHLDDMSLLEEGKGSLSTSILVSVTEKLLNVGVENSSAPGAVLPEYGVCIIDTVLGTVVLAQFQDDYLRSRLRTLLAKYQPNEVLLELNFHSAETRGVIRTISPSAVVDTLRSGTEMPTDPSGVFQAMIDAQYFEPGLDSWPVVLKALHGGMKDGSSALVTCAVGGALHQLKRSLIDFEIISMGKVFAYVPPDAHVIDGSDSSEECTLIVTDSHAHNRNFFHSAAVDSVQMASDDICGDPSDNSVVSTAWSSPLTNLPSYMTLDAIALSNLEILQNNFDKTEKGSLFAFVNRCRTAFGQRLLKEWVVKPLFRPKDISRRAAAVEELLTIHTHRMEKIQLTVFKGLPDLERLLSRVHTNGIKKTGTRAHPNTRAILYESQTHNAKKIRDFADILTGFESLLKINDIFRDSVLKSELLVRILKPIEANGKFPFSEVDKILRHFREIFDERQAKKDGYIKPRHGVNAEYDDAKAEVARLETVFESYLREMKKVTGINDLNYWGSNKDRYQIEVPMSASHKVPKDWSTKSQKKTHRRYWTPTIEKTLASLVSAEERVSQSQADTLRAIFEKFDSSRALWSNCVTCTSTLDALFALASVSSAPNYVWPDIISLDPIQGPVMDIQGGRHPMLEHTFALK
jgi:DNA mismatch repair protein MSH6